MVGGSSRPSLSHGNLARVLRSGASSGGAPHQDAAAARACVTCAWLARPLSASRTMSIIRAPHGRPAANSSAQILGSPLAHRAAAQSHARRQCGCLGSVQNAAALLDTLGLLSAVTRASIRGARLQAQKGSSARRASGAQSVSPEFADEMRTAWCFSPHASCWPPAAIESKTERSRVCGVAFSPSNR